MKTEDFKQEDDYVLDPKVRKKIRATFVKDVFVTSTFNPLPYERGCKSVKAFRRPAD